MRRRRFPHDHCQKKLNRIKIFWYKDKDVEEQTRPLAMTWWMRYWTMTHMVIWIRKRLGSFLLVASIKLQINMTSKVWVVIISMATLLSMIMTQQRMIKLRLLHSLSFLDVLLNPKKKLRNQLSLSRIKLMSPRSWSLQSIIPLVQSKLMIMIAWGSRLKTHLKKNMMVMLRRDLIINNSYRIILSLSLIKVRSMQWKGWRLKMNKSKK